MNEDASKMTRRCPKCNEQYDDTWLVCLKDNTTLVDRAGNKCTDVDRDTTDYVRLAIDEGKNELRDIGITPERILQEVASRFADPSAYSLVIANLITIVMATLERWDLWTVIFVYLIQNVVIGFFSMLRIADLRKFAASLFFIFHYSVFNLLYFIVLIDKKSTIRRH
jgi:hypothetical protein